MFSQDEKPQHGHLTDTLQAKSEQTHREDKRIRTEKKGKQVRFEDSIIDGAKDEASNNEASDKEDEEAGDVRVYIRHGKVIREGTNEKRGEPDSKREANVKVKSNLLLAGEEVKLVSHGRQNEKSVTFENQIRSIPGASKMKRSYWSENGNIRPDVTISYKLPVPEPRDSAKPSRNQKTEQAKFYNDEIMKRHHLTSWTDIGEDEHEYHRLCSESLSLQPLTNARGELLNSVGYHTTSRTDDHDQDHMKLLTQVNTLYKRKADKVKPVPLSISEGSTEKPGGVENWQEVCLQKYHERPAPDDTSRFDEFLKPRLATFARGSVLKPERLERIIINEALTYQERELLQELLFKREGALAWEFSEIGRIRPEVMPPQRIRTIKHDAWQLPAIRLPRSLEPIAVEMLRERIKNGILEPSQGPYRNPWFLGKKKKPGTYRLINAAMGANKVTIRDANMPPDLDEFAEDFAGMAITSIIDWFSGYDQIPLDERDRDITAFMTPLGLLRHTTILQGAANSVAQFQRTSSTILRDLIPNKVRVFMDDIGVKGPKTRYNEKETLPGIRQFVLEHFQNLDECLYLLEIAGVKVSGEKSQFGMPGVKVVGWVCDYNGRRPDIRKVEKILNWPTPNNVKEVRGFLGLTTFFRILIEKYQLAAAPLYTLLKQENIVFIWTAEADGAFYNLKQRLSTFPVVLPINYMIIPLLIYVLVDASGKGWGAVLMQKHREKRHPARYESGVWNEAESKYDAGKRECRAVLKALKKFRYWLYGVHFTLEIDAQTLVAQLNRSATDLPGALVTSWLAWIRLFDFTVKHVPGDKHTAADGLSRRPATEEEIEEQGNEQDIDEFIQAQLNSLSVKVYSLEDKENGNRILDECYSEESEKIARYLCSFERPLEMPTQEFKVFRKKALKHLVQDRHLFRRPKKDEPMKRVVDKEEDRMKIIRSLHNESGHRGREGTYQRVATRYWWIGMFRDVTKHVRCCKECQFRDSKRVKEPLHPTWISTIWYKVAIDIVHMQSDAGKQYLVLAREELSGWPEGEALKRANTESVGNFLWEKVFCRWGIVPIIVFDGGPENRGLRKHMLDKYKTQVRVISAYHPASNGMVETGHKPIKDALSKMTDGTGKGWVKLLPLVLFADRTTAKRTTGMTPYKVLMGEDAILPIEAEVPTWMTLPWELVRNTTDLLAMRARQIERRDKDLEEAVNRIERIRKQNKEYFDEHHVLRDEALQRGEIVLLHNTKKSFDMSNQIKLQWRWLGPYRIQTANKNGSYRLEELDGTTLQGSFNGDRLKKYYKLDDIEAEVENKEKEISEDSLTERGEAEGNKALIPEDWNLAVII